MGNVRCHACDGRTDGRTVESRAVFCLSRIRNNGVDVDVDVDNVGDIDRDVDDVEEEC